MEKICELDVKSNQYIQAKSKQNHVFLIGNTKTKLEGFTLDKMSTQI